MIHDYSATDYSTTYYDKTFNMNFLNGKKIITDILLKLKPIEEKVQADYLSKVIQETLLSLEEKSGGGIGRIQSGGKDKLNS